MSIQTNTNKILTQKKSDRKYKIKQTVATELSPHEFPTLLNRWNQALHVQLHPPEKWLLVPANNEILKMCLSGSYLPRQIVKRNPAVTGDYEVLNYRNALDLISNYRCTVTAFYEIADFRLRHVI